MARIRNSRAQFASALVMLLALAATPGQAQVAKSAVKLPADITFKGLPGAPQTAVLYGDPTKDEFFVMRFKFAPGMKILPHYHPDATRTVVVLSGTLYFALGDKWDESKFAAYPAGTFFSEPSKTPHYAWAKDGEVILQVTGIGPTGTVFLQKPTQ